MLLVYLDLCTIKTGGTGMIILSIGENNTGHVYCLILRKYVVYSELEAKSLGPWRHSDTDGNNPESKLV